MKNFLYVLFSVLFLGVCQGQEVNKYEYVIVDSQFGFVKKVDGYDTSTLTKFLFNKLGYKAYLDTDETPENLTLNTNRCKALFATAVSKSNWLTTRIIIELRDCNNKLIYTSEVGESRIKDYKRSYRQAFRNAFQSVSKLNYKFDKSLVTTTNETPNVEKTVVTPKKEVKKPKIITKKTTPSNENLKGVSLLYAQKNSNGYQLANKKSEVLFVLLNTSQENKFIIKDKNGTLTKSGSIWIAEYYKNGKLITENYQIKF